MIDLDAIGRDVVAAHGRRLEGMRRRRRAVRAVAAGVAVAGAFAAAALASGIGADLQLDPAQWTILGKGSTDDGRGQYVHAKRIRDGSHSTFMVEHDAGLSPYAAFRLYERTRAAADSTSPVPVEEEQGPICTPAELTRAESVALASLAAFPAKTPPDASKEEVDAAVAGAFASHRCRGLAYASERARFVYAGIEPRRFLMPGAR
jgi:hypothetical protein